MAIPETGTRKDGTQEIRVEEQRKDNRKLARGEGSKTTRTKKKNPAYHQNQGEKYKTEWQHWQGTKRLSHENGLAAPNHVTPRREIPPSGREQEQNKARDSRSRSPRQGATRSRSTQGREPTGKARRLTSPEQYVVFAHCMLCCPVHYANKGELIF